MPTPPLHEPHRFSIAPLRIAVVAVALIAGGFRPEPANIATAGEGQETSIAAGSEVLGKHPQRVMSLTFSPAGDLLAAGTGGETEGTVHLWNLKSRREVTTLKGHGGYVYSVAFSTDGRLVASGSFDRTVRLWSVPSEESQRVFDENKGPVYCVGFSPDGALFAYADGSRIRLRSTRDWRLVRKFAASDREVQALAFAPDGKTLASGGFDETVQLWDTSTASLLQTMTGHEAVVRSLAFSPDGKTLVVGRLSGRSVWLWETSTGKPTISLETAKEFSKSVAFSPVGTRIAVGEDDAVFIFDSHSGKRTALLKGHSSVITAVAFSPDGKTLASGGWDKTVRLWRAPD
jgi:WD40 repeat protein